MSRSIGDFVAASVGCICEPGNISLIEEINEYELSGESKFIVIASDGVWEFLSNKRVMEIVMPFYKNNDPSGATEKLIEESVKCWKKVF
jgi:serine/threonine protein phosphatase PrpC